MREPRLGREADGESALRTGLAEYNAGRFWNAHERWERVWRGLSGDEKRYLQGLIMLAAAAWHAQQGHEGTARRLLERAAPRLETPVVLADLPVDLHLAGRVRAAQASATLSLPPVSLEPA